MKAYKYRVGIGVKNDKNESLFERDLETLSKNLLYAPTINELNDPTEGIISDDNLLKFINFVNSRSSMNILDQYKLLLDKFKDMGVYSMSKNIKNELLWAYYASGHTGYAIEYEIDIIKDGYNYTKGKELVDDFDVLYNDKIPTIDIEFMFDNDMIFYYEKFIGSKSTSWAKEEEKRLVFNSKGFNEFDYRAVTGIYFGLRMEISEMHLIMNLLKGRGIKYYKMDLKENSYNFYPKPVDDKYKNAPKYKGEVIKDVDPFYLTKDYLLENYKFLDKIKKNINLVKTKPLISEIFQLIVVLEKSNTILKVHCYTKNHIFPIREFQFILN